MCGNNRKGGGFDKFNEGFLPLGAIPGCQSRIFLIFGAGILHFPGASGAGRALVGEAGRPLRLRPPRAGGLLRRGRQRLRGRWLLRGRRAALRGPVSKHLLELVAPSCAAPARTRIRDRGLQLPVRQVLSKGGPRCGLRLPGAGGTGRALVEEAGADAARPDTRRCNKRGLGETPYVFRVRAGGCVKVMWVDGVGGLWAFVFACERVGA